MLQKEMVWDIIVAVKDRTVKDATLMVLISFVLLTSCLSLCKYSRKKFLSNNISTIFTTLKPFFGNNIDFCKNK